MKQSVLYNDLIRNQAFDEILTAADIAVACNKPIVIIDWINDNTRMYKSAAPVKGDSLYLVFGKETVINNFAPVYDELDYVELNIPEIDEVETLNARLENNKIYISVPQPELPEIDPTNELMMEQFRKFHGVLNIVYIAKE